jgi:ubiquitin-protein ligase
MSNNRPIQIIVELPTDFPNEKPKLTVVPMLRHTWVSQESGEVQSPGLLNVSSPALEVFSFLHYSIRLVLRALRFGPSGAGDHPGIREASTSAHQRAGASCDESS